MRINPDPCLGVVKKYWANVQGALARVKEAIQEGWCENPTGFSPLPEEMTEANCLNEDLKKNAVSTHASTKNGYLATIRIK